ncbi:MAG TPA: hypothetical protein VK808_00530 [Bacteroidia bacterium]|jgi:hypothetical protein|nr:hypothetical protein [Bacteroidia bacterium]
MARVKTNSNSNPLNSAYDAKGLKTKEEHLFNRRENILKSLIAKLIDENWIY